MLATVCITVLENLVMPKEFMRGTLENLGFFVLRMVSTMCIAMISSLIGPCVEVCRLILGARGHQDLHKWWLTAAEAKVFLIRYQAIRQMLIQSSNAL